MKKIALVWVWADLSVSLGKFYGSFNNILNVLGCHRNEMLAVHLVKTYCLASVLYSCEVWSVTAYTLKRLSVAWNNVFRKIFNACWRESPRSLQFYCNCLPISYLIDQRRLLFWKKMITSDNILLRALAKFCQGQIYAIGSKYNIVHPLLSSTYDVKRRIFAVFSNTVV